MNERSSPLQPRAQNISLSYLVWFLRSSFEALMFCGVPQLGVESCYRYFCRACYLKQIRSTCKLSLTELKPHMFGGGQTKEGDPEESPVLCCQSDLDSLSGQLLEAVDFSHQHPSMQSSLGSRSHLAQTCRVHFVVGSKWRLDVIQTTTTETTFSKCNDFRLQTNNRESEPESDSRGLNNAGLKTPE